MRQILQDPDPRLYFKNAPFGQADDYIRGIEEDMRYWIKNGMNDIECAGISAPQLGENIRMIAVRYGTDILVLVNPEIVMVSEKMSPSRERCMSLRGGLDVYGVYRHKIVKVRARLLDGREVKYKARDAFGRALQHEIDHLGGILINHHYSQKGAKNAK